MQNRDLSVFPAIHEYWPPAAVQALRATALLPAGSARQLSYASAQPTLPMTNRLLERLRLWFRSTNGPSRATRTSQQLREERQRALALQEEAARHKISAYDRAHWQPLLDLISELDAASSFGTWRGAEKTGFLTVSAPWIEAAPVVGKFSALLGELGGLVPFDWTDWDEGTNMANDPSFDFDTVDIFTKCKVMTMLIRADRICEGALVGAFSDGRISNLLRSMDRQLSRG